MILYRDGRGFGAIAYTDLQVRQSFIRFIENDAVPGDATVVDHTWRYVNKSGGPDRRFNNNRQLPVLQLGELIFTSSKGLNIQLNVSNAQQSLAFANSWLPLFHRAPPKAEKARSQAPPKPSAPPTNSVNAARKILGVGDPASAAEISAAYRHLAQMYHPDKVAGLAPEFQTLADMRMREINAAYEVLKNGSF